MARTAEAGLRKLSTHDTTAQARARTVVEELRRIRKERTGNVGHIDLLILDDIHAPLTTAESRELVEFLKQYGWEKP